MEVRIQPPWICIRHVFFCDHPGGGTWLSHIAAAYMREKGGEEEGGDGSLGALFIIFPPMSHGRGDKNWKRGVICFHGKKTRKSEKVYFEKLKGAKNAFLIVDCGEMWGMEEGGFPSLFMERNFIFWKRVSHFRISKRGRGNVFYATPQKFSPRKKKITFFEVYTFESFFLEEDCRWRKSKKAFFSPFTWETEECGGGRDKQSDHRWNSPPIKCKNN